MYHQPRNWRCRFLSATTSLIACLSTAALAAFAETPERAEISSSLKGQVSDTREFDIPVLPHRQRLRTSPVPATIYQLDLQPLGERNPLLLVHGLRGEYRTLLRWDRVIKEFHNNAEFCDRFKIYLIRYDSTGSLKAVTPQFKEALIGLHKATGGKKLSVLALSLGGNVVEEAMLDPEVDAAVKLVFTMGTPFHGSPLFTADWFQYSLYKNLSWPLTRVDHSIAYRLYFERNPHLLAELGWDNADGLIPDAGPFRSLLLLGPKGHLNVDNDANERLLRQNTESTPDKSKFITYAGYLLNPYLLPTLRRQVESTILAPYTLLTMRVPAHLAREHPVLKMLNREISRVVPRNGMERKPTNWPHVYALNDGITPVNSAIFLPAAALKSNLAAVEDDIPKLRAATDVRLARVFRNADHLTFVDGYRPGGSSPMLRDELNPDDGYRQIFAWIMSDLIQSEPAVRSQVARDAEPPAAPAEKTID